MFRSTFFVAAGLAWLCTMPLAAQDLVLGQIYGNGVHAYFSEDYLKAHQLLTTTIDGHTQDPRAYYFRGLVLLKLGRPQEAESDFQQGAKLESAIDPTRAYDVARALERVQGGDRAKLEQFRLQARMDTLRKLQEERAQRYQATLKQQREFLQQQSGAGLVKPVEADAAKSPEVVEPKAPAAKVPADPFSVGDDGKTPESKKGGPGDLTNETPTPPPDIETPAEKPTPKPEPAKPAGGEDPFGPDLSKPTGPTGTPTGPTGTPTGPAGTAPKAASPKPPADDDPFGAGAAASKPATPVTPKPPATPDTAKPAAGGDDPFAPETTKPSTPAATPKKPDAAAKPATEDDPFATPSAPAKPEQGAPAKTDDKKPDAGKSDDPFAPAP